MKRNTIKVVAGLFFSSLMFTACKKDVSETLSPDQKLTANKTALERQAHIPKKDLVLKEMTLNGRTYTFFYNQRGDVDSVQALDGSLNYTYVVHYKGARIDSVTLVRNGRIESVNTNIQYKGNNITQFDYYCRACGQPVPSVRSFSYDNKGRIVAVSGDEQLTYDANNNVTVWTHPGNIPAGDATYTYDNELNPLYAIDNLFVIFVEEPFIWQYAFSQHNTVSKTYTNGVQVAYQNQYSSMDQLVSKTFYDQYNNGNNRFSFTYY